MARNDINKPTQDLQSDDGAVLWSFVQGEQQEYPITLNFLTNAFGYTFEAVLVEANNVEGSEDIPDAVKPAGVKTTLTVRVPQERGTWAANTAYTREDVVLYNSQYYKLRIGTDRINAVAPDTDVYWEVYVPNKVYVQFTEALSTTWTVQPTVSVPIYGFFELRVTEPAGGVFRRTWKPVRGIVAFNFSPTEMV